MPTPATTGQLRTSIHDMEIGDYIQVHKPTATSAFYSIGTGGKTEIPLNGIIAGNEHNGYFHLIKVSKGLLISDRVWFHTVSWDNCNNGKIIQGVPHDFGNIISTMTSNTSPSGVASASKEYSYLANYYSAWKAFNKTIIDAADCWAAEATSGYLQYKFFAPTIVSAYSLAPQYGIVSKNGAPKDWTFEGSNDGLSWEILDKQISQTVWNYSGDTPLKRRFTFINSKEYLYYRINISSNNGHNFTAISELEMFDAVGILRSLTGGVAYADENGNKSMTNQQKGGWPTNNEWDKYIINFPTDKIQAGKTIDDVFHVNRSLNAAIPYTWCQDTPIIGFNNVNSATATASSRVANVMWSSSTVSHLPSNASGDYVGFRPVFEYKEV